MDRQHIWEPYVVGDVTHPGVSVSWVDGSFLHACIEPEGGTVPHVHSGEERILVVRGQGILRRDEKEMLLVPGDRAVIPPGTLHSLRSVSRQEMLVVLSRFTPSFREQATTFPSKP